MTRSRIAVVAALCCAATAAGCGFGPGEGEGDATLTVTRDYGSDALLEEELRDVPESETVMRALERNADIETRFGGGFVQSIEGLAGGQRDGRRSDWFFYVNGVESPVGAAEVEIREQERIWWDYRDWSSAMRVPAVVGSWPEPLLHGYQGRRYQVRTVCPARAADCDGAVDRLDEVGVDAAAGSGLERIGGAEIRVMVGPWDELRGDPAAALIEKGPEQSGVFARFEDGGRRLVLLDERGRPARTLGPGSALIAATRRGEQPPTWVVAGTDAAGVEAGIAHLDESSLRDRYAVAVGPGNELFAVPER